MIKIELLDEVNCIVSGLTFDQRKNIIERTKLPVKGAHTMVAFKTGNWDGKESLFQEDGYTYQYLLDKILEILDEDPTADLGELEFIDSREHSFDFDEALVDEDYAKEETGFTYREHQLDGVNKTISNRMGVLELATNAGKSVVCASLSKYYDDTIKTIATAPSQKLVNQLSDDYSKFDLNFVNLSKVPPKKRKEAIEKHDHLIMTHKLLLNVAEMIDGEPYALFYDEGHLLGEKMQDVLRNEYRNCPIRIGMTGSLPKDRLKKQKIFCSMGGDILSNVKQKTLIEKGYSSHVSIRMVETEDPEVDEISHENKEWWDWTKEQTYHKKAFDRLDAIAKYIHNAHDGKKNTLILCHPEAGEYLQRYFGGRNIKDSTPIDTREAWLDEFETSEGYQLVASFGTTGTGISVDNIQRMVFIDIGKDPITIIQSVGRGLRLDGKENALELIDISSGTRFGKKHKTKRKTVYKREGFPFIEEKITIKVKETE